MFSPAVSIAFAKRPDALPEGFLEDRAKFSGRNIDPVAMMAAVPHLLDQLRAHLDWLDQTLADSRPFLQGTAAGLADLAAYHPIWFLCRILDRQRRRSMAFRDCRPGPTASPPSVMVGEAKWRRRKRLP